jgi:hypothetical protein
MRRFEPNIAERLQVIAWWNWSETRIEQAVADFRSLSPEAFLERHEGCHD